MTRSFEGFAASPDEYVTPDGVVHEGYNNQPVGVPYPVSGDNTTRQRDSFDNNLEVDQADIGGDLS